MANNNKKYDFSGKVALVTGSSSGIGAAIAIQFARYGAKVTITGRDPVSLEETSKQIEKETGDAHKPLQLVGDMLDQSFVSQLVTETVGKYGRLDFLVNNAGASSKYDSILNENVLNAYDQIFTLNVRAPIQLTHLAVPYLEKTKGNIINISSVAAIKPFGAVYSSSKAALDMVTKATAAELGLKGIRVNSINPGPVITNFGRSMGMDSKLFESKLQEFKENVVLDFIPYPDEIANLASFLASDDAKNMTGSIVVSDTGTLVKTKLFK